MEPSSTAAARSGSIVRSPPGSTSTTTAPCAARAPLDTHVDALVLQRRRRAAGRPGRLADAPDEPRRAAGPRSGDGHVGRAATAPPHDARGRVRRPLGGRLEVDHHVLDHVTDDAQHRPCVHDDARSADARSGDRKVRRATAASRARPASIDAVAEESSVVVARAARLLESAERQTTWRERRRSRRLGGLLADREGRELLFRLTDEVLRTPTATRSMQQLRALVDAGLPRSLPPLTAPHCALPPSAPASHHSPLRRSCAAESAARHAASSSRLPTRRSPVTSRPGETPGSRSTSTCSVRRSSATPRPTAASTPCAPGCAGRRRLRLGQDLGVVRQSRRAGVRPRGRTDRRSAAHRLYGRLGARSTGVRQPRHGGVPRPRPDRRGVLPGARRAGLHPPCPQDSCCRAICPTRMPCSTSSSSGPRRGASRAAATSRSAWSRVPTWRWSTSTPSSADGCPPRTTPRPRSTPATRRCSGGPWTRRRAVTSSSASAATTSSTSPWPSRSASAASSSTSSASRCWRAWRRRRHAPCLQDADGVLLVHAGRQRGGLRLEHRLPVAPARRERGTGELPAVAVHDRGRLTALGTRARAVRTGRRGRGGGLRRRRVVPRIDAPRSAGSTSTQPSPTSRTPTSRVLPTGNGSTRT